MPNQQKNSPRPLPKKTIPPSRPGFLKAHRWLLVPIIAVPVLFFLLAGGGVAYALRLEESDGFCASCHTEPEVTYVRQASAQPPTTLAAFHTQSKRQSVMCIECHSGGGPFGRAQGLTQGTQDLVAYMTNHYQAPAVTTSPLGDDACLKCHADVPQRGDFNNHFHRFLAQWQNLDPQAAHCVTCHTAHTTTADAQAFLQTQTVTAVCDNCHSRVGR